MRYTQDELEEAFRLVQNKEHWKGPISAVVPANQLGVVVQAVAWFTSTPCVVVPAVDSTQGLGDYPSKQATFLVTSIGYWAGPAGDH